MDYTREDYITGRCTHEQYYGQYVTEPIIQYVGTMYGLTDAYLYSESFNAIPLIRWDTYASVLEMNKQLKDRLRDNGDTAALGSMVCILKEAARQWCMRTISVQMRKAHGKD